MKSERKGKASNEVGVELKYCEHCGGLWVRECGTGVYCKACQPKVADLPIPPQKPIKLVLPVRRHTVVEEYGFELEVDDLGDFEAAGGAA
jgi:ferredoxin